MECSCFILYIFVIVLIDTDIISVQINNNFEYRVLTEDFLKDLLIKKKPVKKFDRNVEIEELKPYIQRHPMVSYDIKKPCAIHITKMYDLVRAAYGFFNLLKVDIFLNPTDIKPAQSAAGKSLMYTTEGEVSAELHGITQTNPSFILMNVGYLMNFYRIFVHTKRLISCFTSEYPQDGKCV